MLFLSSWSDPFPNHLILTPLKLYRECKKLVADSGLYGSENELWLSIADAWNDISYRDNDNTLCINLVNSMTNYEFFFFFF